ncbi:MAG TPA: formylglycine-generating enzyme family protein [Chthoniobacter sp.]|nr:formylglycine-generating enzyme family protein [Chthoniobacter sp.]
MIHDPQLVALPGGEFTMGESVGDKFANDTERPAHRVTIAPFALGRFVVSVGEYRVFRPGHAPEDSAELPVVNVSWNDAQAYCDWLSTQNGRRCRLPSEAEWEYACRAGSTTPFACGNEVTPRDANYFYSEAGERIGPGRRTRAGEYPANAFGLHDLHGNVCEWVEDAWRPNYLVSTAADDRRVIRGGAWDYLPRLLRCAWRDGLPVDCRRDNLGFRLATSDLPL